MSEVFLVRHAPTAANAAGVFQGRSDVPALPVDDPERHRLHPAGAVRLTSSPLSRALTGAAVLLPDTEPVLDPRLVERSVGDWEGLDHATVRARWPESYVNGRIDPLVTPPNGESMHAFCARVIDVLTELACAHEEPVYVVTHNGWIRTARLVNGDIGLDELFATPEPFLEPLPFVPAPEVWRNPFARPSTAG